VSRVALVGIALAALVGLAAVELLPSRQACDHRQQKLSAARLAERGMELIKEERLRRGHQLIRHFDPAGTGLIGDSMTLVTSVPGNLKAKQTSLNPNFAAALVQMLHDAGVREGDAVAVGCSGSFPALNVCVYAALETMRARPIIVASASASQFGANMPDLLWIDMERLLWERGLISFRAAASSLGGYEDRGLGMSHEARRLVVDAVRRNGLELLDSDSLAESIDQRARVYRQQSGGAPIRAYINVGGGAASVGRTEGKHRYRPGLNLEPPRGATEIDSVITRFAKSGVPVIHLVEVGQLAADLGLPEAPQQRPAVGTGGVFQRAHYNRWLAAIVLVGIVVALRSLVWTGITDRIRLWGRRGADEHTGPGPGELGSPSV
jgi:poly-gamma-glutamate system protein